jgi:hypothetical protein
MDIIFVILCSVLYSAASVVITAKMINRQVKLYFDTYLRTHLMDLGVIPTPVVAADAKV